MAFKGSTTAGYNQVRGKQLQPAKTGGKVAHNPRKPLPGGRTNVVTKATRTGMNPNNSRTQKLNANRVQRAGGPRTNPKNSYNNPAIKVAVPRQKDSMQRGPFSGYNHLANTRNVPAGRGNIRNAGTVTKGTAQRLTQSRKLPSNALNGKGSFGGFVGQK